MTIEAARLLLAKELREADPAYMSDRRHPFHPTNQSVTLEFMVLYGEGVVLFSAYNIDSAPVLAIFEKMHRC